MHNFITVLSWVASIGSITANILVANKKLLGAKIWTFATFLLLLLAIYQKNYSQIFLFGIYELINIYTWIKWGKEERRNYERRER